MASQLENLILAQRAAASAATSSAAQEQQQALESGLGDIKTEEAEVAPYYNDLIRTTNKAYETNLGSTRSSAAARGAFWGSGGLSNKELALGTENAYQVSQYSAERTRKLADIARRRTLLKKQTAEKIGSIRSTGSANLESAIADIRYKDYQTRYQEEQANYRARLSASSSSSSEDKYTRQQNKAGGWTFLKNGVPISVNDYANATGTDLVGALAGSATDSDKNIMRVYQKLGGSNMSAANQKNFVRDYAWLF